MKYFPSTLVLSSIAAAVFSSGAMADHNSPHGAGWANMPNDIHNIRIEDDLSASEFRSIVQYGGASDTVNRYLDTTASNGGRVSPHSVQPGGGGSRSGGGRR